eukprot:1567843-Prorocentrum_lima.AAC.1
MTALRTRWSMGAREWSWGEELGETRQAKWAHIIHSGHLDEVATAHAPGAEVVQGLMRAIPG